MLDLEKTIEKNIDESKGTCSCGAGKCKEENKQVAMWLTELMYYRMLVKDENIVNAVEVAVKDIFEIM